MKKAAVMLLALVALGVDAQDYRCKDEKGEYWSTSPCPEGEEYPEAGHGPESGTASGDTVDRPQWASKCDSIAEMAGIIMTNRQAKESMSAVMDAATKSGSTLAQDMVIEAYDVPDYATEEYQRTAVTKFSNKWYSRCVKTNR